MGSLKCAAVALTLAGSLLGCSESTPVGPVSATVSHQDPPAAQPIAYPDAPAFPAPSRSAAVYVEGEEVYAFGYAYHQSKLASRYVFYEDGTFALQFSSLKYGFFEYPGKYTRTDSTIDLIFSGYNRAGPWYASAKLIGESMNVYYNGIMIGADFNNGLYVRSAQ